MAKKQKINIIMHYPTTDEGREELACRVAQVHADAVTMRLKQLDCPLEQKMQLLDAIIADAKAKQTATPSEKSSQERER